jgi:tetratricopeptide (TPR) repeat protein
MALEAPVEAAVCFEQALQLNSKYLKVYQNLAALMESQGNLAAARNYLEEARKLSPLNAERLFCLGKLCLQTGAPEKAKQYLEKSWSLGHHPSADHQAEMAETFLAAGLEQIAEELFVQAIEDAPQDAHLYNRLGVALRRQHKNQEALDRYQQALKLDPRNEKVYFNLGVLYFDLGEKDKALESLRTALELRPDFPEAQDFLRRHYST